MRYFFRVEYDGTYYGGWQFQPNAPSIQQSLEEAFSTVTRSCCKIIGAGRTDAGVHARRQGAHIDLDKPFNLSTLQKSINAILPSSISIFNMQEVDAGFHARFSALRRIYSYRISCQKHPLLHNRAWTVYYNVDWNVVSSQLRVIVGTHDFSSFCSSGANSKNCFCTVYDAGISEEGDSKIITISANRFLYNMVRAIVGTLIDIGRGALEQSLEQLLLERDRRNAGTTAPACGLVLEDVYYGETIL